MYRQALIGLENSLGRLHPSTLRVMINMSRFFQDMGELEEAESMYVHALKGFQTTFGPGYASSLELAVDIAQLDKYLHGEEEVVPLAGGK